MSILLSKIVPSKGVSIAINGVLTSYTNYAQAQAAAPSGAKILLTGDHGTINIDTTKNLDVSGGSCFECVIGYLQAAGTARVSNMYIRKRLTACPPTSGTSSFVLDNISGSDVAYLEGYGLPSGSTGVANVTVINTTFLTNDTYVAASGSTQSLGGALRFQERPAESYTKWYLINSFLGSLKGSPITGYQGVNSRVYLSGTSSIQPASNFPLQDVRVLNSGLPTADAVFFVDNRDTLTAAKILSLIDTTASTVGASLSGDKLVLTASGGGGGFNGVEVERITSFPYTSLFSTSYANIFGVELLGEVQRKPSSDNSYAPDYTITFSGDGKAIISAVGSVPGTVEGQLTYVRGAVIADGTAPTTPGTPTASAITSATTSLSWAPSTDTVGVTGYEVFNGSTSLGTTTTANINLTGLTASTAYAVTVKAHDAAGNVSAASGVCNFTTLASTPGATVPATITTLTVTQLDNALRLDWSAPANNGAAITGYLIRGRGVGTSTWTDLPTQTALTKTITGLPPTYNYEYQVASTNSQGNSPYSASVVASSLNPAIVFEYIPTKGVATDASTWAATNSHLGNVVVAQPTLSRRFDFSNAASNGAVVNGDKGMATTLDLSGLTEFTLQFKFIATSIPTDTTRFPITIGSGSTATDFNFYTDGSPVGEDTSKRLGATVCVNSSTYWYETISIIEGNQYDAFLHWKLGQLPTFEVSGTGVGTNVPNTSQPTLSAFAPLTTLRNNYEFSLGSLTPLTTPARPFPGKILAVRLINVAAMTSSEVTGWVNYVPAP